MFIKEEIGRMNSATGYKFVVKGCSRTFLTEMLQKSQGKLFTAHFKKQVTKDEVAKKLADVLRTNAVDHIDPKELHESRQVKLMSKMLLEGEARTLTGFVVGESCFGRSHDS